MASLLPTPEPADPVEGAAGHFTHSNWVKQSVKNLDVGTVHTDQLATSFYGRNRIINGDFSINQRGHPASGGGINSYCADHWKSFVAGAGSSVNYLVLAMSGALPEQPQNCINIVAAGQTLVSSQACLSQPIESVRTLSGKTVTVSFWAKAASGTPDMAVSIDQDFGGGGSTGVTGTGKKVKISTTWTRYSLTLSLPSIAGKTVGTNSLLWMNIWVSAGSNFNSYTESIGLQNNAFDIWGVQLEEGLVLTPYEQKSYADELRACQRYFYRLDTPSNLTLLNGSGMMYTATGALFAFYHPVRMRITPVVSKNGTGIYVTDGTTTWASNPTIGRTDWESPYVSWVQATGGGLNAQAHWPMALACTPGGSSIDFSAEF